MQLKKLMYNVQKCRCDPPKHLVWSTEFKKESASWPNMPYFPIQGNISPEQRKACSKSGGCVYFTMDNYDYILQLALRAMEKRSAARIYLISWYRLKQFYAITTISFYWIESTPQNASPLSAPIQASVDLGSGSMGLRKPYFNNLSWGLEETIF